MAFNIFKTNLDSDKYRKDKFLNEPFIEHYFALQLFKPADMTESQFENYQEELVEDWLGKVAPAVAEMGKTKEKGVFIVTRNYLSEILKSISTKCYNVKDLPQEYIRALQYKQDITTDTAFLLIRFPSVTELESKFGFSDGPFVRTNIRKIPPTKKANYKFSPLQTLKFAEISQNIEMQISVFSGVSPHRPITLINGIGKEIIVTHYDGIHYFYYPLSKRAKLYLKCPELEKKIFDSLSFPKFAKWLLRKENESEYMQRNAERTRQILKKYNIKL